MKCKILIELSRTRIFEHLNEGAAGYYRNIYLYFYSFMKYLFNTEKSKNK